MSFFRRFVSWDAVFVVKGLFVPARAIAAARVRTGGAAWLSFNPDSPFNPARAASSRHILEAIPLFDVYLIWAHSLMPRLRSAGARRVEYLAFGHDREQHFPGTSLDASLERVVTFVGTFDRQRAKVLEAIADLPLRIYGSGWEMLSPLSALRKKVVHGPLYGEGLRRVVSSSLASINILRSQNHGSHNMRTFEVTAMGGVLLTTRSSEQQQFFPEKEACLMYESPAELRKAVEDLTEGRIDTKVLREKAQALSVGQSYDARASRILDVLSSIRS